MFILTGIEVCHQFFNSWLVVRAVYCICTSGKDGSSCANSFNFLWCLIGIIHRAETLSRIPFNITLSFFVTTMLSFVELILHPLSANNGMDSSGCSISLEWNADFALIDSSGMSNCVVATDSIV
jgi:hypothetical protein